jgi:hypothetical protein
MTIAALHDAEKPDELVPDAQAKRELGVTNNMTWWRMERDEKLLELGFPPPVRVRNKKFRFRSRLENYKRRLWERAEREAAATL